MAIGSFPVLLAVFAAISTIAYLHLSQILLNPKVDPNATSIFDFSVPLNDDGETTVSLSQYKGKKAYLVVNVACKCGLTDKNYAQLQELYNKYSLHGLEILAFPCNNFGGQEPGTHEEIMSYVRYNKHASFPILGKVECDNRALTHPLFAFLKQRIINSIFGPGLIWNFAKFLCDENGVPIKRYLPIQAPSSFEGDIVKALGLQEANVEL